MAYRGVGGVPMVGGIDMGRKRLNEGRNLLSQAISEDRAGRIDSAKQLYRESQLRFTYAQNEPTLQRQERVFADENIAKCQKRISELSSAPAPLAAPTSSSLPPRPPQRVPVPVPVPIPEPQAANSDEFQSRIASAILLEKPNVHWDDIAGLGEAKRQLIQTVILPAKLPQFFVDQRSPWRGILLYGPPGTGKSYLAKAAATEASNATFLTVSTSDLLSRWLGESEKLIRALFDTARSHVPAVIFIDEIDSLLSARSDQDSESSRRIKTEFLVQMDGVGKSLDGILILAATNTPWSIDAAARRRFEKRIYIPLPDREARIALIKLKTRGVKGHLTDAEVERLADLTEGFSGADISVLCRDAAMAPLNRVQCATHFREIDGVLWPCEEDDPGAVPMTVLDMSGEQLAKLVAEELTINDFEAALETTRPTVSQSDLARFEAWTREFGQEGN